MCIDINICISITSSTGSPGSRPAASDADASAQRRAT